MGYPDQHHISIRPSHFAVLILLLAICFPTLDGYADPPRSRIDLPPGQWDHVVITDRALKPIFAPLASHRNNQGLRCRVISTEIIRKWSGRDNTMEAVRWFIAKAHREWGTRYVLLGGDAEIIPVPLGYYQSPHLSWEIPLDLYYAAHGGHWDLDGDGILGEIGDDAPGLTPAVALGRAPVSNGDEAWAFVHKVIAFENQSTDGQFGALLAAEVGTPYPWSPGMEVRFDFAWETERVAEILTGLDSVGNIHRLYQNPDSPYYDIPLSAESFLDVLGSGRHRYLGMMVRGIADTWSMGSTYLRPDQVNDLEEMDHSFFLGASITWAGDFRGDSVLKQLLTLPDGGCVGALAPSSLYFMAVANPYYRDFWQSLAEGECDRIGDAYLQVMVNRLPLVDPESAGQMVSLQCLNIVGDPALLFFPESDQERTVLPIVGRKLTASVSPNPFNPITEISFIIPEGMGTHLPTQVVIFDLGGRRIATILDSRLEPGLHAVQWNGENDHGQKVGSGVFFARVQAGDLRTVEKLVLVE